MSDDEEEDTLPHPLDLPSLSSKPSFSTLASILESLTPQPPSWTARRRPRPLTPYNYTPWLTSLIATPMPWLTSSETESIISMASTNLALRAGRVAAPDMTRSFVVDGHEITLFEPSWTGDSLGYKTWGSSLILAKILSSLHVISKSRCFGDAEQVKCLGLGEGTGLLGITAVKVMKNWNVTLTDLPGITDNLRRNMESNCAERAEVKELDWRDPPGDEDIQSGSFEVIIGSDLFYDSEHPMLVVRVLERYLKKDQDARIVVAYPLRESHLKEIKDFESGMKEHFRIEKTGVEIGMDDWDTELRCKWVIYQWKE
jgi:predicted nicotinamide N-methyase